MWRISFANLRQDYATIRQIFMPELPEVETIRRDLNEKILNKKITEVVVREKRVVRNRLSDFSRMLRNQSFRKIDRVGKLLIFTVKPKKLFLLIHSKMTGQLVYVFKERIIAGGHTLPEAVRGLPNKYSHVIFHFNDGSRLFYNDLRQFGYLKIIDGEELRVVKKGFGPEPLSKDFKLAGLREIFKGRTASVKAILLNQRLIAGIGNIYADEILFQAGVRPERPARGLTGKEAESVFKASKVILDKAIKHRGTTFNNYVDGSGQKGNFSRFLKVYGREGERCLKCGTVIKKIKVAGRGTRYCKKCQR